MEKTFGQIIAEVRRRQGLSQKELAEKIKKEDGESISPQYLNDIEHDRRDAPSDFLIAQISKSLSLDKEYLIAVSGRLTEDLQKHISRLEPDEFKVALKAFRKELKK